MAKPSDIEVPFAPWEAFYNAFQWKQGEHVGLIGPTGQGKTTLGLSLLDKRDYVAILGTKPTGGDKTLSDFIAENGYKTVPHFPEYFDPTEDSKLAVWPNYVKPEDRKKQRLVMGHALRQAFVQRNWCVFADEVWYLTNRLKLSPMVEEIWTQGRSIGVSLMAGTQRPAYVPLMIYDQSTHLFFFRDNDETNLRRIGGVGYLNNRVIMHTVARLDDHETLYVNTRKGQMVRTRLSLT